MSPFATARPVGFSTGALAGDDFRRAVELTLEAGLDALELSALRLRELRPLVDALPELDADLAALRHVSFHAPSRFGADEEEGVIAQLEAVHERDLPIVVHPDVLHRPARWRRFGSGLVVENMDVRKASGQTAEDLAPLLRELPEARLCLDLAHARQVDPTLGEAERLLLRFAARLAELHLSHVDADSRHHRLTPEASGAFREVAHLVPADAPVILESPMGDDPGREAMDAEVRAARRALGDS